MVPTDDVKLRFRDEKAQFLDLDDFDAETVSDTKDITQSFIVGSKMNDDHFRKLGSGFENESGLHDEPPFA